MAKYGLVVAATLLACLGCSRNPSNVNTQGKEQIVAPAFASIGRNDQGLEEYRHEKTGMVFVKLPGGTFKMGCEDGEPHEWPVHEVKVDGFVMARHEVTQAVWDKVMRGVVTPAEEGGDEPVGAVTWEECAEFCRRTGLRLPTEAEWEYACRAGTVTDYYWGTEPDEDFMWCPGNSGGTRHPVGLKKPNAFGLHDMSGSMWEWCQDWYAQDYYIDSPGENPKGPQEGERHVVRGGSWCCPPSGEFRSSLRGSNVPSYRSPCIGFRCAANAD
jgi:sulfatase modifying factor 1